MRARVAAMCLSLALALYTACAMAAASAEVEAAKLEERIKSAYGANDYERMIKLFAEYHKLNVRFPAPLWYAEAVADYHLGRIPEAKAALDSFLSQVSKGESDLYENALKLAAKIDDEIDAKSRAEQEIHWTGTLKDSNGRIRVGTADLLGRKAQILGLSLRCEVLIEPINWFLTSRLRRGLHGMGAR
jgi:tetratricopeptide (TPR) repeat protein